LDKAASTLELELQTYPRLSGPHSTLAHLYQYLGDHERALEEIREALRLQPDRNAIYQNLGTDLVNLNRLDEAEAVYKLANQRAPSFATRVKSLYLLAFLRGDSARMAQLASSSLAGRRGEEDAMLGAQADTEAWYGRAKASRAFTRRAMDSALNDGAKEAAAAHQVKAALFEAETGQPAQARADAEAAMKLAPNRDVKELGALALAQAGDTASAEKLAATLDKALPLDTLAQRYWLPTIRAEIALQRKNPAGAIEMLQVTSPIELGNATLVTNVSLYPVYVRGEAYLALQDGNRAAPEFQKYIDHRGLVRNSPIATLAGLGLARAYAMQGNSAEAKVAYQDFLTTWKDADPDLPIFIQAKADYAKLR
jgi:tetratricopeptide (TPR) repeat protein